MKTLTLPCLLPKSDQPRLTGWPPSPSPGCRIPCVTWVGNGWDKCNPMVKGGERAKTATLLLRARLADLVRYARARRRRRMSGYRAAMAVVFALPLWPMTTVVRLSRAPRQVPPATFFAYPYVLVAPTLLRPLCPQPASLDKDCTTKDGHLEFLAGNIAKICIAYRWKALCLLFSSVAARVMNEALIAAIISGFVFISCCDLIVFLKTST